MRYGWRTNVIVGVEEPAAAVVRVALRIQFRVVFDAYASNAMPIFNVFWASFNLFFYIYYSFLLLSCRLDRYIKWLAYNT